MPNPIAYMMLLMWPVISTVLFLRLPLARALIWSLLIAYLILPPYPAAFDFPAMPPLSKATLPNLTVFVLCMIMLPKGTPILPDSRIARLFIGLFIATPILTVQTNAEPIVFLQESLPGLKWNDAIALPISQGILILGYLMARPLLRTTAAQKDLLVALMIGGLAYSIPMLIEVRLSPQINTWVYGFFQHVFSQSVRGSGYRPLVFLDHGIWAAFFVLTAMIATLALWRPQKPSRERLRLVGCALYLAAIVVLCKTMGSIIYMMFLTPLVVFLKARTQLQIAAALALLAISYPALKGSGIVPSDTILAAAERVSAERAYSLQFRFENEDQLLERAREKPWFGWGSWGRNHLHDPVNGTILTVTDGRWIITIGVFGWLGFIAEFGLLALPIFLLFKEIRLAPPARVSPYIGPLALLLAVNMVDMLPNATLTPITWLLSGALLGHAEMLRRYRLHDRDEVYVPGRYQPPPVPVQTML